MSLKTSSLPDELISEILKYTDCKTLLSCRTSCHRLKSIVDQSPMHQYVIELFRTGMCDGQLSGVGSAERLDRLRRSQTSWKSPTWHEPTDFPYWKKIRSFPAAVSGNLMVFYCIASDTYCKRDLLLLRFPSELRGILEQQWSLNLDCNHISAICVDDSQDLLCFLSFPDVHIRTLSTGGIHPLRHAVGPIYSFASGAIGSPCRIYDDYLMLVISLPDPHILVFNWRTGGNVAKIPSFEYAQCTFLNKTNIIFLYDTRDDDGVRKLRLRAVTLPNTADDASLHSYDFEVPTPKYNGSPEGHVLCANTLPSNNSTSYVPGLFHTDPRGRLLALEIETMFGEMSESTDDLHLFFNLHVLCIPHDTVLSYIKAHTSNTETVVVPWKSWGPGNTRLTKVSNGTLKRNSKLVCGMHVLTGQSESFCQGAPLRIMDYHPRRVARILATPDMNSPGEVYIGEGPKSSNTTVKQRSSTYTSRDKELPYALKEIILPNGIESDRRYHCTLGEDVVVLSEYVVDNPIDMDSRIITRVFYHYV